MNENNKEREYVCKFCGKVFKTKVAKTMHEIWCVDNPDKTKANEIRKKFQGKNNPMHDVHRYGENAPMHDVHRYGKSAPNFGNRNEDTPVWNDWIYQRIHKTIKRLKTKPENCETCRKKTKRLECSYNSPHWNKQPLYYSINPKNYVF